MCSGTVVEGVAAGLAASDAAVTTLVEAVQAGELRLEGHEELSDLLRRVRGLPARLEYVGLAAVRADVGVGGVARHRGRARRGSD